VSADVTQGEQHFGSRGEAVKAGWCACLDEEFRKIRAEVGAKRSRVDYESVDHGHRIGIRMVAVARDSSKSA
jgi:hypothetical protein